MASSEHDAVRVCSEGSDRAFDERQSFPIGMAVSYLSIAYVTRNPVFAIFFGYAWETFELVVLVLAQQLANDKHSRYAQWFSDDTGPLTWFVPVTSDAKARTCVESPLTSLFFDPVIFVSAALLWSVGVERLMGASYDEQRSLGACARRTVYYVSVFFTAVFASRVIFQRHLRNVGDTERTGGAEPDIGMVMSTLVFITILLVIPVRSGQRNGFASVEARRAYLAYVIYVMFVSFITLFGVFGGPLINVKSSWMRSVIALTCMWFTVLLVAAVRVGRWGNASLGEYLRNKKTKKKKRKPAHNAKQT